MVSTEREIKGLRLGVSPGLASSWRILPVIEVLGDTFLTTVSCIDRAVVVASSNHCVRSFIRPFYASAQLVLSLFFTGVGGVLVGGLMAAACSMDAIAAGANRFVQAIRTLHSCFSRFALSLYWVLYQAIILCTRSSSNWPTPSCWKTILRSTQDLSSSIMISIWYGHSLLGMR